jgi:aerobic-type carbon monoxide dehydrogenase small subunit (CoxS/CutS family)
MEKQINVTINGETISLPAVPGEMLSDMLRYRLQLTGTKIGCQEAECGACTVIMDGEPVLSCVLPAERAHGTTITTIEGLSGRYETEDDYLHLHPLQQAFVAHGAVQCGFCIPGQIMTAAALLQRNPQPGSDEIRHALKDTLCRCAGYPTIERAIQTAAHAARTGEPVQPPDVAPSQQPLGVVGTIHVRPDSVQKVTGAALFTDDLVFPDMLHGIAKRAGIPSGILGGWTSARPASCRVSSPS